MLEAAAQGIYGKRALMRLSPELIGGISSRWTTSAGSILDDLRHRCGSRRSTWWSRRRPAPHGRFDVIFCRNVLIYFDERRAAIAAENLYENLAPGGFICLGHTESMSRISPLFEVRRFADAIVYQRPGRTPRG